MNTDPGGPARTVVPAQASAQPGPLPQGPAAPANRQTDRGRGRGAPLCGSPVLARGPGVRACGRHFSEHSGSAPKRRRQTPSHPRAPRPARDGQGRSFPFYSGDTQAGSLVFIRISPNTNNVQCPFWAFLLSFWSFLCRVLGALYSFFPHSVPKTWVRWACRPCFRAFFSLWEASFGQGKPGFVSLSFQVVAPGALFRARSQPGETSSCASVSRSIARVSRPGPQSAAWGVCGRRHFHPEAHFPSFKLFCFVSFRFIPSPVIPSHPLCLHPPSSPPQPPPRPPGPRALSPLCCF